MKTIKFLVQTLLIAVPLVFASCSSDDDFEIPTPENSNILLSEYKVAYDASGNYNGVSFTYNSNNELEEAITYYYPSTGGKQYYQKYVFGAKNNNKRDVEIYSNYSTTLDNWSLNYTATLNYNAKGKITKIEDYMHGYTDIDITWDGDRATKTYVEQWGTAGDSAQYYKGNYVDYPALESEWDRGDNHSKTTTTFSTYANYYQMIPVEFYALELGQSIRIGAYFSDNAVSKTVSTTEQNSYTDATKTQLSSVYKNTTTTDYTLTFGSISKKVPEKVKVSTRVQYSWTYPLNPSSDSESDTTSEQTYTFTYVKK